MTTTTATLLRDGNGQSFQALRIGANSVVAFNASTQSAAFDAQIVRIQATENCHIVVGSNPTATTSDTPLWKDNPEYIHIEPGDKIAVIKSVNAGNLHITVCS